MPTAGAQFTREELAEVLGHYDIGEITEAKSLLAGDVRALKAVITSENGRFLLKRRPRGKDDMTHVAFAHAMQTHLESRGFAVAGLIGTRKRGQTTLRLGGHTYELFRFVQGRRCDGSSGEVADAGRQLAIYHRHLRDFACDWKPLRRTYHDSVAVRGHLRTIRSSKRSMYPEDHLPQTAHNLLMHYNYSSVSVNSFGFDSWPEQIVHCDWHPGNILFKGGRVVCVLDFDSARIAPAVTDLANGALQFSIIGESPDPAQWPDPLDWDKMGSFVRGYIEASRPEENMLRALPDLMIELMIAEAVLPIATTGFFGKHSGRDFMEMIHRKCSWIDKNRQVLEQTIFG